LWSLPNRDEEVDMMSYANTSPFLRRALIADGAISGATGVLMVLAAGFLDGLLGVPGALLRYAGLSLIPFAAFLLYLARRPSLASATVWLVIALNVAWVVGSGFLLVSGLIDPTALGYAFIIVQAVAVAVFVELQYVGLRRPVARVA
jgi:hypothetical protein